MVHFCPSAVRETQNRHYSHDDDDDGDADGNVPTMIVSIRQIRDPVPMEIFWSMHSRTRN